MNMNLSQFDTILLYGLEGYDVEIAVEVDSIAEVSAVGSDEQRKPFMHLSSTSYLSFIRPTLSGSPSGLLSVALGLCRGPPPDSGPHLCLLKMCTIVF
jgi:hypothetical protein